MTMYTEKQTINMTIAEFQAYLFSWQQGIDQLEEEVKQLKEAVQSKYKKQIADLRQQVKKLEEMLNTMKRDETSISSTQWADTQVAFIILSQSFNRTAFQIRDAEQIPLGWLQGFTDARKKESEGWVEGMEN